MDLTWRKNLPKQLNVRFSQIHIYPRTVKKFYYPNSIKQLCFYRSTTEYFMVTILQIHHIHIFSLKCDTYVDETLLTFFLSHEYLMQPRCPSTFVTSTKFQTPISSYLELIKWLRFLIMTLFYVFHIQKKLNLRIVTV